jgi:DNA end-binding protein Ku
MRSVWNGTITFGQIAVPVKAYSATEERGSGLHQLHVTDGGRIKLRRTCEIDGADVPFTELGKGVDLPDGDVVVLTQQDMAGLPVASAHAIEVRAFTPLEQIDPLYFDRSYYLAPEPAGTKPYVLLGEALRQSGRVAVVTVALRQREALAMLRERGNVIVLTTLLWPDEIRSPEFPFLDEDVAVQMRELRSAVADVERLSGDFEPSRYTDGYREALRRNRTRRPLVWWPACGRARTPPRPVARWTRHRRRYGRRQRRRPRRLGRPTGPRQGRRPATGPRADGFFGRRGWAGRPAWPRCRCRPAPYNVRLSIVNVSRAIWSRR